MDLNKLRERCRERGLSEEETSAVVDSTLKDELNKISTGIQQMQKFVTDSSRMGGTTDLRQLYQIASALQRKISGINNNPELGLSYYENYIYINLINLLETILAICRMSSRPRLATDPHRVDGGNGMYQRGVDIRNKG